MKIENDERRIQLKLYGTWLLCICAAASIVARLAGSGLLWDDGTRFVTFPMEGLLFLAMMAAIYAITLRLRLSAGVSWVLFLLFPAANTYVFQFRGDPIKPGDFFSLGTAQNVVSGYDFFPLPEPLKLAIALSAGALILLWAVPPLEASPLEMELINAANFIKCQIAGLGRMSSDTEDSAESRAVRLTDPSGVEPSGAEHSAKRRGVRLTESSGAEHSAKHKGVRLAEPSGAEHSAKRRGVRLTEPSGAEHSTKRKNVRLAESSDAEHSAKFKDVRLAAAAFAAILGCAVFFWADGLPQHWQNTGALRNGCYLNLFAQIHQMQPEEPDDYDPAAVAAVASVYDGGEEGTGAGYDGGEAGGAIAHGSEGEGAGEKPVIIAIMDESFSDFSQLGSELRTDVEVTPFIDSLRENTIRGSVLTSVFGGTTANAEWEFLTGCSMAWMPTGSVPYQQYVGGETYSLVTDLKAQGYRCLSMHPFRSDGWNRPAVYDSFGFDHSYFLNDFPHEDVVRSFISDREMVRKIISVCNDLRGQDLFIFGITMQNHGAYDYEGKNYEGNAVSLEGYSGEYPLAEQYLTLLRETDDAVKLLIEHFQSESRPVVVVFFGDHYPKVEEELFEEIHGGSFDTLEEQMLLYQIPFFIWTNYDIPEEDLGVTSLNFLANYVMETAGLELSPYQSYLSDLKETIPAMNASGYFSKSQDCYLPCDEAQGEEAAALLTYQMVQFNGLFDEEHKDEGLFLEEDELFSETDKLI